MRRLILIICLLFLAFPVFAQDDEPSSLIEIHYALETIDSLEARGILSHETAEAQRAYYLDAAETLTGERLSADDIYQRAFEPAGGILRFLTFVNIIWALASLIIVISAIWLFIIYIVPLIRRVPLFVYEILAYCAAFAFIWYGQYADAGIRQFVALPGVLVLGFLFPFTYFWRVRKKSLGEIFHRNALVLIFLALSLIWGFVAIQYDSELIAFLTVLSGLWTLTLTRWLKMLLQPFGYEQEDPLIEGMVMCFGLMLIFLLAETQGLAEAYQVFGLGIYWIGTYGYFGALEIKSSKWRNINQEQRYLSWQLLAILSGLLGLYIGINWQIESMSETAGTFLLIYVLTKYIEIPNWRKHWAWASLGLGLLLYVFALLINEFPQFFLLG